MSTTSLNQLRRALDTDELTAIEALLELRQTPRASQLEPLSGDTAASPSSSLRVFPISALDPAEDPRISLSIFAAPFASASSSRTCSEEPPSASRVVVARRAEAAPSSSKRAAILKKKTSRRPRSSLDQRAKEILLSAMSIVPRSSCSRRKKNEREWMLRNDPFIMQGGIERTHVWCKICERKVVMDARHDYYENLWKKHRDGCMRRQTARVQEIVDEWNAMHPKVEEEAV